jgi:hypothetical protein
VSNMPPRSVIVWGRLPVFCQVTVVPAVTGPGSGSMAKSTIVPWAPAWASASPTPEPTRTRNAATTARRARLTGTS